MIRDRLHSYAEVLRLVWFGIRHYPSIASWGQHIARCDCCDIDPDDEYTDDEFMKRLCDKHERKLNEIAGINE